MSRPVITLKCGGSVITDESAIPRVVAETRRWIDEGWQVVLVVSAIGETTNRLIELAARLADQPADAPYAALLATGEARSAAACALALAHAGIDAALIQVHQLNLRTCGHPIDAAPVSIDVDRLRGALAHHDALVLPGFVGCDERGDFTLLGRGGSDLTALFAARQLGARCRLVKDVDGWFVRDPALDPESPRYETLHWDDALACPAPIVQTKAVAYARELDQPFEIAALDSTTPTHVGPVATRVRSRARGRISTLEEVRP
ncbi:MAG: hypothetical protein KDA21_03710 [Phycisphaerales bacterium]|nr:hypothetical protein [Phycisphaerales bacterium]